MPRGSIPELIARSAVIGCPWLAPLYRAAADGLVDVVMVEPGERIPSALLDPLKQRLPRVVIVGDDGAVPCGPEGFAQAAKLLRWSRALILHATGGAPEHYRLAAHAAAGFRRCLMIETNSQHSADWRGFAAKHSRALAVWAFEPRPGMVHPLPEVRHAAH